MAQPNRNKLLAHLVWPSLNQKEMILIYVGQLEANVSLVSPYMSDQTNGR